MENTLDGLASSGTGSFLVRGVLKTKTASGAKFLVKPATVMFGKLEAGSCGYYALTSGGKFVGATVSLAAGAPDWMKGVSVVDGEIVLDVKSRGTTIIVKQPIVVDKVNRPFLRGRVSSRAALAAAVDSRPPR